MKLFVSSKVESRIAGLEKAGKSGKTLAQKATGIIDSLVSGDVRSHMDAIGSYTKYGEKRIKNCRKYDLGCGYRLITLQRGSTIYVPFLGPHDDCQRWLENNSRLKKIVTGQGKQLEISRRPESGGNPSTSDSAYDAADNEAEGLLELSDKQLRRVFCGLVEGAKK